jgi:hypothetical protein
MARRLIIGLVILCVSLKIIPEPNFFSETGTQNIFIVCNLVPAIFSPKRTVLFFAPFLYFLDSELLKIFPSGLETRRDFEVLVFVSEISSPRQITLFLELFFCRA